MCSIIYVLIINSVTPLTKPSRVGTHTITFGFAREVVLARNCSCAGSLAGWSSIYYTATKCTHHPACTHTHTQYSFAGILTLSGDEVVGSMVALKERRGMTCWVSHLRIRHSCMGGCLSVSPFFSPLVSAFCSPTDPLCATVNLVSCIIF